MLTDVMTALRTRVAFWDQDREMAHDIAAAKALIGTPLFHDLVPLRLA
jgi:histidine ammonia-lyase